MNQEDKELLLKDLSARLPYDVMVNVDGYDTEKLIGIENETITTKATPTSYSDKGEYPIDIVKPYLRPMSSMTAEENKEYYKTFRAESYGRGYVYVESIKSYDWLNAHHFDYRSLIEKGLAIEVTEENNPYV